MEENNKEDKEEKFSDDPKENLRIENEILKLKMQAESGAYFSENSNTELPPEIENEFLRNVQQFENAWKDVKYVKVYNAIGEPDFTKADELSPPEIENELKRLFTLLNKHNINLDVLGKYEPLTIYRFITEELFEHETDDMQMPGMTKNFIYEEFHPNHTMDIEEKTKYFLGHWFEKSFNEYSWELNDPFILFDGTVLSKQEVINKMNNFFDCYTLFSECKYAIADVSFQLSDEEKGIGHAEGAVSYKAEMENGEVVKFEGPFKLYMSNEYGSWSIFYFIFPGFALVM
ncbi:MAG TPA: hypothetical protein VIM07_01675 [Chitinophagaceae bacterium]